MLSFANGVFGSVQPSKSRAKLRPDRGPRALAECGPVAALSKRAHELDQLDKRLRQVLAPSIREQVRLADVRHGRIVFLVPSPAWASRIRVAQADILQAARAMGTNANLVTVKVGSPPPPPSEPPPRMPLSKGAADHLRSAAPSISDPELRSLFLSLASFAE
ncbi:DciA family protein [Oleiagrimonas sp. C23AA]|uniref:DciA family protein n=1 Tax=Oleiagrimonas sp. C23AA TaxID=2719047 RepID=UPI0014241079|nr:DciA family protein [Oleiagrimonas sp. C23AA]NII09911.1 DUF721 domain-containing protein [Oleiagrimonas sp. C23AA]